MTRLKGVIAAFLSLDLAGCALTVPSFDIPTDAYGVPLTTSITRRIRCELASLLYEMHDGKTYRTPYHQYLVGNNYQVAMLVYLNVSNKAGVAPEVTFPDTAKYLFGLSGQADLQREDTLSLNLYFSMVDIDFKYSRDPAAFDCPDVDANLSGELGIRRSVAGAIATTGLKRDSTVSPLDGEFSGSIQFVKNLGITGAGPTWTFRHFTGPGAFASASRSNTDKISFGFASGKVLNRGYNAEIRARQLVGEQIQSDTNAQLSGIRNLLR
ncbi:MULTISPECIES: hypothetical protein [Methylobacterium]|uniref:hypothetical protein n=1 Tax=Methylobacterium TaxID=407 RepID=UPI0013ECCC61|nr:hypothetical protein [Methylobacterium sp. DB0501]NGM34525.1 hypothetical protein [Methylobacterium sp. DB0501]